MILHIFCIDTSLKERTIRAHALLRVKLSARTALSSAHSERRQVAELIETIKKASKIICLPLP